LIVLSQMQVNDLVKRKDQKLIQKGKKFILPNFDDEVEMLQWAGISFGTDDSFRLQKSIKVCAFAFVIFSRGSQL
jgi:hypothetical protein